jgi:transcription initiation factor IIE alpha subunit
MKNRCSKLAFLPVAIMLGLFVILNFTVIKTSYAQKGDVYYTCPMPEHADVISDKPGKCPKCGMDLVAKKKEPVVKYTCPMPEHADVIMDKPGKCPKCGMELVPKK